MNHALTDKALASSKCTMLFAKVTQTSLILTPPARTLSSASASAHDVLWKIVCALYALQTYIAGY